MGYVGQLGAGQSLQIQQQGDQTAIALLTAGSGQQQQQQIVINTGVWQLPPTLFKLPMGFVLRLETAQGQQFVQIHGTGMQTLASPPNWMGAEVLPLQPAPDLPSMGTMQPMQPLQMGKLDTMAMGNLTMGSMSLGDMQMQMNPMVMRMGNMELRMDANHAATSPAPTAPSPEATPTAQRFCTQCGHPVKVGDRFCGACGHSLATE